MCCKGTRERPGGWKKKATDQEDCLSFHHFYCPVQLPELHTLPVGSYSPGR